MRKIVSVFLIMALSFTLFACEKEEKTVEVTESASSVENDRLTDESVVVSVGKTTAKYKEFKIYKYFMKSQYEKVLTDKVWEYTAANEKAKSIGQEAVEDILRLIIQIKVINKAAAESKVTLGADEKEEADYRAVEYFKTISEADKKKDGITLIELKKVLEENKLANKMYNIVIGKVNANVADANCVANLVQLIKLNYTPEEKEQVRAKANQIYQRVTGGKEKFFSVAKQTSDDPNVEQYVGKLDSRTKLAGACLGLKQYQISQVVEEADAFYVAYCIQVSSPAIQKQYKNTIIEKKQLEAFQEQYKKWAEKYEVVASKALLA